MNFYPKKEETYWNYWRIIVIFLVSKITIFEKFFKKNINFQRIFFFGNFDQGRMKEGSSKFKIQFPFCRELEINYPKNGLFYG
jgi:hypothetical protein